MSIHPYLTFGGNCREAFTRYQEIFGGELVLMPMSDMPAEIPVAPEQAELILHAALTFGDNLLMASDDPTGNFEKAQGIHVNYTVADAREAKRVFDALTDGGTVTMPLAETFFSPMFGMCVDRFGIPWMIHTASPDTPS